MAEAKFKVGDRVHFVTRDYGTITKISQSEIENYPIEVRWDKTNVVSTFTKDGYIWNGHTDNAPQLTVVDKAKVETEMGKIAGVINHNITSKEDEKMDVKSEKFKVGDRVYSPHFGEGVITEIDVNKRLIYPIHVHWTGEVDINSSDYNYFTSDGNCSFDHKNPEYDITPLEVIDLSKEEDTGVVDRMMDALDKKTDDAINPSHYKVKGLPEAYEIMNHLMHREQLEGFLWGNIIKYAYRYGRKGDKKETAGKIEWYANKLKDIDA